MNGKYRILCSMAIGLLAVTALVAEVRTDYDRTAEFSRYKTYSWERSTHRIHCGPIELEQPLTQHSLRKAGRRLNPAAMFPSWRWR